MLREQTKQHICGLSDEDLMEYIRGGREGTYTPDACDFALKEYQRRNLDPASLAQVEADAKVHLAMKAAELSDIAKRPLGALGRILAFIAGGMCIALLPLFTVGGRLKNRGEYRKAREMWTFAFMGLGTILLIGMAIGFFEWLTK